MLNSVQFQNYPLPFVVPVTWKKGNSPNGTGRKNKWVEGSGEAGVHLKWGLKEQKSVWVCTAYLLFCSASENGGKGVYFFRYRQKSTLAFKSEQCKNSDNSARNDTINRVVIAPLARLLYLLGLPPLSCFSSLTHSRSLGGLRVCPLYLKMIDSLVPSDRSRAVRRINNESSSGGNS